MKKKFYQTKKFDAIHVPNIIMKVKPYLYCTEKVKDGGINHPAAEVKVFADVWFCTGTGKLGGFGRKSVSVDYIPRCEIDLEKNTISKKGDVLTCDNTEMVIEVIRQRVFD